MSATIEKYVVLTHKDASLGEVEDFYDTLEDARAHACPGNAIVEIKYEMTDTELVEVVS